MLCCPKRNVFLSCWENKTQISSDPGMSSLLLNGSSFEWLVKWVVNTYTPHYTHMHTHTPHYTHTHTRRLLHTDPHPSWHTHTHTSLRTHTVFILITVSAQNTCHFIVPPTHLRLRDSLPDKMISLPHFVPLITSESQEQTHWEGMWRILCE